MYFYTFAQAKSTNVMEKWQDPNVVALWIAIVILVVFTIILVVIKIMHTGYKRMTEANLRQARLEVEHQKKLLEVGLLAQEKERNRIASDLHDGLIGKLSVIRMKAQLAKTPQDIEVMLGESIAEARRISHDLMPPMLEFSAVSDLIESVLEPWKNKFNIQFVSDVRSFEDLNSQAKLQLVRMLQEVVTNAIKHAKADKIEVTWRHTPNFYALSVKDTGVGFDSSGLKQGVGLSSLEMRAQYLGGRCRVASNPGKGTRFILAAKAV